MAPHPRPSVNIISLCTGGYGLDFGVELAMPAARSVCLVEREAFAVARLVEAMRQGLIPEAAIWSDARTFNGRPWRGLVDGVIGGIPCQPHSLAGRRRGADDPRDLWSIARRIVVQSGAWWCLIENVPGMLAAPEGQRAGAERVWRDLQRLGFAVEGGLFSAAEVGASHERERLFILGVADGDGARSSIALRQPGDDGQERAAAERVRGNVVDASRLGRREGRPEPELPQWDGRSVADAVGKVGDATCGNGTGLGQREAHHDPSRKRKYRGPSLPLYPPQPGDADGWRAVLERAPQLEPAVRRMADGLASRVDQLRLLGNGVVPLAAAHAFRTLVARLAARGSAGAAFLCGLMEADQ